MFDGALLDFVVDLTGLCDPVVGSHDPAVGSCDIGVCSHGFVVDLHDFLAAGSHDLVDSHDAAFCLLFSVVGDSHDLAVGSGYTDVDSDDLVVGSHDLVVSHDGVDSVAGCTSCDLPVGSHDLDGFDAAVVD